MLLLKMMGCNDDIQNLLFLGFILLLTILFLYGLHVGFSKMIQFPTGVAEKKVEEVERVDAGEGFLDFGLSRILMSFDRDGNLILPEEPEPKVVPMEHEKNTTVVEKLEADEEGDGEDEADEEEPSQPNQATLYLEDRYPHEAKYDYLVMDGKKDPYLTILGYMDGADMYLSIRKNGERKEITKIKHKLYGTYECIYKRPSDDNPVTYRFERDAGKERFMKILSGKEDDVYFFEKKREKEYTNGSSWMPVADILYFSEKIGTISSKEGSMFKIELDEKESENADLMAFGWALHQSLTKADAEDDLD